MIQTEQSRLENKTRKTIWSIKRCTKWPILILRGSALGICIYLFIILCIYSDVSFCQRSKLSHEWMIWISLNRISHLVFQAVRTKMLNSSANVVTLPDLKAWTWYCVSIQSRYDFYNKISNFTSPHCMQTEGNTF